MIQVDEPKWGGGTHLKVLLAGGPGLADAVRGAGDGGRKLGRGLAARVGDAHPGTTVEISELPYHGAGALAAALRSGGDLAASPPDILLLAPDPDHDDDADQFELHLVDAVKSLRQQADARVIALNCCTVDPLDSMSRYDGSPDTTALLLHRLDLKLIELSLAEGISIVDVDRIIADLGAAEHVRGVLDYSPAACEAICDELYAVIDDYGFFEHRPLVVQVSSGRA